MNKIDIALKAQKYVLDILRLIEENLSQLKYHHLENAQRSILQLVNSLDPKMFPSTFKYFEDALNVINHILFK